ncbi:MAG TPA: peptidase S10, partial [Kribbella sp.]|nr:peptidase S10 [Kribbella sp.]
MAKDESAEPTSPSGTAEPKKPVDDLVTTQHSLTIDGRELNYTASTGRIVLRQEVLTDGKFDGLQPKAEVFLTAYTLDDAEAADRPVTFAFNGGPGSSSIWLHL